MTRHGIFENKATGHIQNIGKEISFCLNNPLASTQPPPQPNPRRKWSELKWNDDNSNLHFHKTLRKYLHKEIVFHGKIHNEAATKPHKNVYVLYRSWLRSKQNCDSPSICVESDKCREWSLLYEIKKRSWRLNSIQKTMCKRKFQIPVGHSRNLRTLIMYKKKKTLSSTGS